MTAPLPPDALAAALRSVPRWQLRNDNRSIGRAWRFPDFATAFGWVGRIVSVADALDHHPEIAFGWGRVSLSCTTAETGTLTMRDIRLAAAIDALDHQPEDAFDLSRAPVLRHHGNRGP